MIQIILFVTFGSLTYGYSASIIGTSTLVITVAFQNVDTEILASHNPCSTIVRQQVPQCSKCCTARGRCQWSLPSRWASWCSIYVADRRLLWPEKGSFHCSYVSLGRWCFASWECRLCNVLRRPYHYRFWHRYVDLVSMALLLSGYG